VALARTAPAAAADSGIPVNDGWVTDLAGMLDADQERALEALMASYAEGSSNEIALLTVPELGGRSLEGYALEVARAWGLGQREQHNGALLLVARDERKLRIEVGRGLEGTLTDSISGRIIRDVIAPELRRGRPYEGLRAGIEAMHRAAGGDYGAIDKAAPKGRFIVGLLPLVLVLLLILHHAGRGGRKGRGRRRDSGLATWLLLNLLLAGRGGRTRGWHGSSGGSGGGFGGFGGGGGFSGGGASGGW
jgi:uncharacterized protein